MMIKQLLLYNGGFKKHTIPAQNPSFACFLSGLFKQKYMLRQLFFVRMTAVYLLFILLSCSPKTSATDNGGGPTPPVTTTNDVGFWLTLGNQTTLLQKQSTVLSFGTTGNGYPFID